MQASTPTQSSSPSIRPRRVDVTDASYGDVAALDLDATAYFERKGAHTVLVVP
jgi:hypothetical protein